MSGGVSHSGKKAPVLGLHQPPHQDRVLQLAHNHHRQCTRPHTALTFRPAPSQTIYGPKMPKDSSRQPLPTSSSDFALPPSSSPGASSFNSLDDPNILFNRIRRPSLLQRSHHSPLSNAYAFHARRRSQASALAEESESEKERMSTDSPSSSENHTPPLKAEGADEDPATAKPKPAKTPLTPPRRRSSTSIDSDMPTIFNRRLNFPVSGGFRLRLKSTDKSTAEAATYS